MRCSSSSTSKVRRCVSSNDATACPSVGVITPEPTESSTLPTMPACPEMALIHPYFSRIHEALAPFLPSRHGSPFGALLGPTRDQDDCKSEVAPGRFRHRPDARIAGSGRGALRVASLGGKRRLVLEPSIGQVQTRRCAYPEVRARRCACPQIGPRHRQRAKSKRLSPGVVLGIYIMGAFGRRLRRALVCRGSIGVG